MPHTVESSGVGDAINLGHRLLGFVVQRGAVAYAIGGVAGLHGQIADALQVVVDLVHAAFSGLGERDAVVGVARSLGVAVDLRRHAGSDRHAGCIMVGAVDAHTGRPGVARKFARHFANRSGYAKR